MSEILKFFKQSGGYARLKDLKEAGFHTREISALVASNKIEKIKAGLYRLDSIALNGSAQFTKVDVCKAYPEGVVCLLSALEMHGLTTFNPFEIYVAIPRQVKRVKLRYPKIKFFYFTERLHELGKIVIEKPEGVINIYDREKSICDMFRYRNKLGHDVAMESLKTYMRSPHPDISKLLKYATECRVHKVIFPYLEALTRQ
jgi:predicted transcriptional regulator of viral defense system